ncbi:glycoside hydrolase family 88 protein [Catenovulum adriaticum]|uniref:Glycoside hydrolase family 88 protein n=1 Tax=Catenovulum adriaticum TaxID=2984846 RepID=A0ABY7AQZ1_9ALTE|nr:glycoside hydrolase family 88 protein [Catenovulum sp. TS8]WAJ71958.1 glycoside hydrolase family 88 protein [Catenovulum sp. TS8]
MKRKYLMSLLSTCILINVGCSEQTESTQLPTPTSPTNDFSVTDAKANLTFAKNQYIKMAEQLNNPESLTPKAICQTDKDIICVPRSEEHDGILMEAPAKWTNGFFPGVIWKLLSAKQHINHFDNKQEKTLIETAKYYQQTLFSEAKRGTTHDLGFILYDSFGEALNYSALQDDTRQAYKKALNTGRATLATRYSDEKQVIRSWDWVPQMKIPVVQDGEKLIKKYELSNPWTYPVIVDNMMNLEFLLASNKPRYHEIAFNHAKQTSLNHYFYEASDTKKQYPLSYHVYDYGKNKPGNWQGVGNVSAWARGQAWSFYGFVTIVEALDKAQIELTDYPDFKTHLDNLYTSVEHVLQDDVVPYWDFFAARDNAYEYAENISTDTSVFSGILGLCDKLIEDNIKPYNGYRPMTLNASMLSEEALKQLEGKKNWHGESIIQADKLIPCGTKPYPETHTKIPRDTSAASIFAAALYRFATFSDNEEKSQQFAALADKIMHELTQNYRTDRAESGRPNSFDLGFVLASATGDMGNGGEIDTPIIYGDFYFVEANIRKIEFEAGNTN